MSKISVLKESKSKGHNAKAERRRKQHLSEAVKHKRAQRAADGKPKRQKRLAIQSAKHSLVEEATAAVANIDSDYEDSYAS